MKVTEVNKTYLLSGSLQFCRKDEIKNMKNEKNIMKI